MRYLAVLLVVGIVFRVASSSHHFQEIGGKYYYIEHFKKLDWFDAREECRNMDAHLVSIQNYKEWESITNYLIIFKSYWVDIRYDESNFQFISDTSGRKAPFLNWSFLEPYHGDDYDCVKLWLRSHKMKTKYCSQENHYICEANSRPATEQRPQYPVINVGGSLYTIIDFSDSPSHPTSTYRTPTFSTTTDSYPIIPVGGIKIKRIQI